MSFHPHPGGVLEPWYLAEYPDWPVYAFVPQSYDPSKAVGLLFFMHGGDKNSPPEQPLKYIGEKEGFLQPHIADIPFITVAPAALPAIDGKRWNRSGVSDYIIAVINDVCCRFNIDRNRIILAGHSMGGFGAYHNSVLINDIFAGVCMSSGAWLETDFRSLLGTNVYIMHGKWDCAYHYRGGHNEPRHHDWCGVSFARAAHELMLRYDVPHVYDEHEGGHGLDWEPTQMALQRFLKWASRCRREPYAKRCAIVTPNGACDPDLEDFRKSRYLELTGIVPGNIELDKIVLTGANIAWTIEELASQSYFLRKVEYPGARLIAENLSGNVFDIQAENVASFILRLHPAMADVEKAVELRINNKSFFFTPQADDSHPDYTAAIKVDITGDLEKQF